MKPHRTFQFIRADEVAECWDGIPRDLYAKLWNVIVSRQKVIPNVEDNGPADVVGWENLATRWNLLTEDEQALLNKLADARDAEFEAWRKDADRVDGFDRDDLGESEDY